MKYLEIQKNIQDLAKNPITFVAVTKGHSTEEILPLYEAGCRNFGESRVDDALEKIAALPKDIKWHMIGTLQKNKVRKIIGKFSLIHSVDTPELAKKISDCSVEMGITSHILLQANTSGEPSKHGMTPEGLIESFNEIQDLPGIVVDGIMTMAPLVDDEKIIKKCFSKLRQLRDTLGLKHLSMGMSHDYPIAIAEGSTILRIGSAIYE